MPRVSSLDLISNKTPVVRGGCERLFEQTASCVVDLLSNAPNKSGPPWYAGIDRESATLDWMVRCDPGGIGGSSRDQLCGSDCA